LFYHILPTIFGRDSNMTTFRSVLKILAETGIVPPGAMVEASIGDSSPSLPEMGCINSRNLQNWSFMAGFTT
jgi:hypothetical protein